MLTRVMRSWCRETARDLRRALGAYRCHRLLEALDQLWLLHNTGAQQSLKDCRIVASDAWLFLPERLPSSTAP